MVNLQTILLSGIKNLTKRKKLQENWQKNL